MQRVKLTGSRVDWLQKGTGNDTGSTLSRHLHQLFVIRQFAYFWLMQYRRDMIIHQMDVITAFLNGMLDEEIYMQQPEGYEISGKEGLVCRLKSLLSERFKMKDMGFLA